MTLWAGRMRDAPAEPMMAYTASLGFDRRLARHDVRGSLAHVRGLGRAGVLSEEEVEALSAGLDAIDGELARGEFAFQEQDEDVHSALERRLGELCGPTGAKVHTGRSRNDQVATATRLYVRGALAEVAEGVVALERALLARAEEAGTTYLPGYTHLQRAQPVLLAHQLLAHGWALSRDLDRLVDSHRRLGTSPLGAGALAGSTFPLDPAGVAAELGFTGPFENSLDAVSDRDFAAEALFDLALLGVHLSRMGEEVVIFASEEFGFYRLADAWSTGSSMLPQKKNPDIAELARGKAGRLIGHLAGFLATMKGLPLAYNRDLQEDKEPLFDAVDQVTLALPAMAGLISSIEFVTEAMLAAADSPALVAIDLAEWLVQRGLPFREAHGVVAELVWRSLDEGVPLPELVAADERLGPEAAALFRTGSALTRRVSPGGGGVEAVATQLGQFRGRIEQDAARATSLTR
ncbi:MAG TPA: argininosuccinate lyase [Acidimicrobiales bacterium]|nr:argininosuccinate lyase [Acidimicrobiales bacterium]